MNTVKGFRLILDIIFLILMGLLVCFHAINSTMIQVAWPVWFLPRVTLFAGLFGFLRLFLNEELSFNSKLVMWVILVCCMLCYRRSDYYLILEACFLILGLCDLNYRYVLRVYLAIIGAVMIIAFVMSRTGAITDLVYHMNGHFRHSFGSIYPTDFAASIFYFLVAWIILRKERCTYFEVGLMFTVVILLGIYCHTRTSQIAISALGIWILLLKIFPGAYNKLKQCRFLKKACLIMPVVFSAIMFPLCIYYDKEKKWMCLLNKLLSGRLVLGQKTMRNNPVVLFGQQIVMHGNGGSTTLPEDYTFIDISYMSIAMRFGLVMLAVVVLLMLILLIRNIDNPYITFSIMLILVTSMIEHHLFEFRYNILILMPFAQFDSGFSISAVHEKGKTIWNR